jgi:hypothetical protein
MRVPCTKDYIIPACGSNFRVRFCFQRDRQPDDCICGKGSCISSPSRACSKRAAYSDHMIRAPTVCAFLPTWMMSAIHRRCNGTGEERGINGMVRVRADRSGDANRLWSAARWASERAARIARPGRKSATDINTKRVGRPGLSNAEEAAPVSFPQTPTDASRQIRRYCCFCEAKRASRLRPISGLGDDRMVPEARSVREVKLPVRVRIWLTTICK